MNPYLKSIEMYNKAYPYAGSNIQDPAGNVAYVTRTGVLKPYQSNFSATAGFNGCPLGVVMVDASWSKMPLGGGMVTGQSCGHEGQYVQSAPPKSTLDWQFYLSYYPDLVESGITTENQANAHWVSKGKQEGRLPNETAITGFAVTGKSGYIDLNTVLHEATPVYDGSYKKFKEATNAVGTSMVDCTTAVPTVPYGTGLYISWQSMFASMGSDSTMTFSSAKNMFYLRPPVGTTKSTVQYGDVISISSSLANSKTGDCGWWGCKVGMVNTASNVLQFGPGGDTGGSLVTVAAPPGSAYSTGAELKYGDPFILMAKVIPRTTSLQQNQFLTAGQQLVSTNGGYAFVYGTDGNVSYYTTAGDSLWTSNKPHTAGKLIVQNDGNLVAYDANGVPQWSTNTGGQGVGPYKVLVLNGSVNLVDSTMTSLWTPIDGVDTSAGPTVLYGTVANDQLTFTGGDESTFSFQSVTPLSKQVCDVTAMKEQCNTDSTCRGFMHSSTDNTWQMITDSASYLIGPTTQDVYVKKATVQPVEGCPVGDPEFIDAGYYKNFAVGQPFGDGQCTVDTRPLQSVTKEYQTYQSDLLNRNLQDLDNYSKSTQNVDDMASQTSTSQSVITRNLNAFARLLQKIENVGSNSTYLQQQENSLILDNQAHAQVVLWSLVALVAVGIYLKLR